ncbi:MAG TPA: hypothetical protein DIT13_11120 [Verrucomicrobiales bacterium]|nr:hypothetical protein [Verrucomicrobiales bacterium]HRJ08982.1 hypothetical protein [Prosthecobacter sp.]HRK17013.1 hypothetical protein [Prosthecobacter sp.]
MARPTNTFETIPMTIAVTPQIRMYLDDLVMRGSYGSSPAEAARILISEAIEWKISDKKLDLKKFILQDGEVVAVPLAA